MTRIAAIDIGTVTTRLFVADVTGDAGSERVEEVERSTDITHLGEDLTSTGALSDIAMSRVADVIERYAGRARALGAERTVAVATSASRDADNGPEFLDLLESRGIRPEVITGAHEAALSFAGATFGREGEGLLVVDIGGGSTELILGDVSRGSVPETGGVRHARSIDVGSRRVTEMFLRTDPPTDFELSAARDFADDLIAPYFAIAPEAPTRMISVAGTVTTLAAIALGMPTPEYDPARVHGHVLSRGAIVDATAMLSSMPLPERETVVGLHPGRAPVIVGGLIILLAVLDEAGLDSTVVSEHDILYGMVLDAFRLHP